MDDIRITGGAGISPAGAGKSLGTAAGKGFGEALKKAVQDIDLLQKQADQEINRVQLQDNGSIHSAIIALEKADLSLRTMIQVRNKVLEAYQEVMRMSV
ncbi:MAG: flagellar hook-basal body complex protein FliE [Deltaproteobacteria bacterium HGW-Deltaproteobacteria-19]|jgi:flagellar hook-basal body complex protein FliE|nr:MAG: flagellar hook-basal body complex protein FliE [Deltaproteobacteria bacterium HGW-Deltaproteobacteria-19]